MLFLPLRYLIRNEKLSDLKTLLLMDKYKCVYVVAHHQTFPKMTCFNFRDFFCLFFLNLLSVQEVLTQFIFFLFPFLFLFISSSSICLQRCLRTVCPCLYENHIIENNGHRNHPTSCTIYKVSSSEMIQMKLEYNNSRQYYKIYVFFNLQIQNRQLILSCT